MVKSQVRIRCTELPGVIELELITPRFMLTAVPLDQILRRHRTRTLSSYATNTRQRAFLRAKVMRFDGKPIATSQLGALLEEFRNAFALESRRAAA